ncbi:MAG: hypothetical protein AB9891_07955 [Anaerolineaceae bacterium]
MKNITYIICIVLIMALVFSGCSLTRQTESTEQPAQTPDINATVNAAVAATEAANDAMEATVSSAVQATTGAATPYPTYTPYPTPTPVNVDVMTEEEIAALVDQEVNEAVAASEQANAATTAATTDDTVTAEELQALEQEVAYANQQIEEAMALADQYLALYSDLAEETIAILTEVESELSALATANAEIAGTLNEINSGLQQGYATAQETIDKLESQAQQAQTQLADVQAQAGNWLEQVHTELQTRTDALGSMQPNQIAGDRAGAFGQATDFVNSLKSALGDGKFSSSELSSVLQMGVNASASLRDKGGPGADKFAGMIDGLNHNVARGEMPQVKSGLGNLEMSLPRR